MAARGATALNTLAGQYYDPDDGLPCADFTLLAPLKRSAAYGAVRARVAKIKPLDAWQADDLHYFLFALRPEPGAAAGEVPVALFTMASKEAPPTAALIITPSSDGKSARTVDLRRPDLPFTVHL